jgi:hypothetical protein
MVCDAMAAITNRHHTAGGNLLISKSCAHGRGTSGHGVSLQALGCTVFGLADERGTMSREES